MIGQLVQKTFESRSRQTDDGGFGILKPKIYDNTCTNNYRSCGKTLTSSNHSIQPQNKISTKLEEKSIKISKFLTHLLTRAHVKVIKKYLNNKNVYTVIFQKKDLILTKNIEIR